MTQVADLLKTPHWSTDIPLRTPHERVPAYPYPSNAEGSLSSASHRGLANAVLSAVDRRLPSGGTNEFREELRRLVVEELSQLIKG